MTLASAGVRGAHRLHFSGVCFAITKKNGFNRLHHLRTNTILNLQHQESEKYVYPDVSVTCDERVRVGVASASAEASRYENRETPQFITHPCLIVEVLSPSTKAYDRGDKFELYRRSTSLREYALVSADKIAIDLHRKDDLNRWQSIYFRAGDTIELESINLTFPLAEPLRMRIERVYRGIAF